MVASIYLPEEQSLKESKIPRNISMANLVTISLSKPVAREYVLDPTWQPPKARRFQIISEKEARDRYFTPQANKSNVYVITGGQRGDESKGKTVLAIKATDHLIRWCLSPTSTHNAGKGIYTTDESGTPVRISLHLPPATLVCPDMRNYVSRDTQVNPFTLRQEILHFQEKTGRRQLGIDYHLAIDRFANLVTPLNRADDVVGKDSLMASTISGATSSYREAAGKNAPTWEDVLYDQEQFLRIVKLQLREFTDRLSHDLILSGQGVHTFGDLGQALQDKTARQRCSKLEALAVKLHPEEIQFFLEDHPEMYLYQQYSQIAQSGFFSIADTSQQLQQHLEQGHHGIIENVQSVLLSGAVKYGRNRTAAGTHSAAAIGQANLDDSKARLQRILVFKFGNTSVGGTEATMSGFLRQDALSRISISYQGKHIRLEKPEVLDNFLGKEQIGEAFQQVAAAFSQALQGGYSLHHSKVRLGAIDYDFSLAEAKALLTSYVWGEKGETSGRARITRADDLVETGVVYQTEHCHWQVRNALDRGIGLPTIPLIIAYHSISEYPGYGREVSITPGMPLRQEHLTIQHCIPVLAFLPGWPSLNADGSNELQPGDELHPHLSQYLSAISNGHPIIAIGDSPKELKWVKEIE